MANVELNKGKCDHCGFKGTVVVDRRHGGHRTSCTVCDRAAWEAAGEAVKEAWLSGELSYPDQ